MSEPTQPVPPEPAPEYGAYVAPAPAAAPPPAPSEYGAYVTPAPAAEPAPPGDPVRGLLAGLGVAIVGAIVWAALVYVTKWEVGIVAVVIGYGVGYAVHRVGRVATQGVAVAAAALAGLGILLGFVLSQLVGGMRELGIGFFDTVDIVGSQIGWGTFIIKAPDGLGWVFLAIGAFAAWRLVAQQTRRPTR